MDNEKTKEAEFKIKIDELFPKFEEHLEIKDNKRILFSGKFGIGKTYFLNEFFENKKDDYEIFHLFPVNYQITANENIIEFLKYDILIELVKKDKDIFKNDNNKDVGMIEYIKKDFTINSFLKNAVSQAVDPIPQIGKILGKPLKTMLEFDKKFQEFKKGNSGIIEQFLKENNTETDCLSQILKNKIVNLKDKKQSVLILDDLERIDPEHIFRILNVFSAHFNSQNEELPNKFGFDKIILVADVQNLKSIFHHKYGEQTDFNGYFDKFFSVEVFQFKNEEIIKKVVDQIISRFQMEDKNLKEISKDSGYFKIFLENILKKSLELTGKEKLNLRQLLKGIKFPLSAFKNGNYKKDLFAGKDQVALQLINISIKALISIFGGTDSDFISVLKRIKNDIRDKENSARSCDIFSYYLLKVVSPFKETEESFQHGWGKYSIKIENKGIKEVNANISNLFFDLLIEYVEKRKYNEKIEVF